MTVSTHRKGYDEFISGMRQIEAAVIAGVKDNGGQLDSANFSWHQGSDPLPPPPAIELDIQVPKRPNLTITFSREEVEDSWDRLDRGDMRQKVRDVVEQLTKL